MRYELEEPSFEEKGRIMNQKEIDGNRSQVAYSSEGKMKGSIEVTNTRDFIIVSKGNNVTSAQGQGVITTKDGSEKANYTFLAVGKVTEGGKPVFLGSAVWSTDSRSRLAFLNNIISFFMVEVDETGNFLRIAHELK
ncbi:MAG: hypothetical protein WCF03_20830 [Nitrososphaeraceae archaeon]